MSHHDAARLEALALLALEVSREAAVIAIQGYRTRPRAARKGRRDLVTEFDKRSEAHVLARLRATEPSIPIVAEEGSRHLDAGAGLCWYVDPLDGTTNYVHGHPFWGVAIGMVDGGEPILGAVTAPSLGIAWHGWQGGHAHRNAEPCRVSDTADLEDALIATGFPSQRDTAPADNFDSFVRVKRRCQGVRRCGAAAIDLCMVADGTFDGYWERKLGPWDTVAGSAIVLAAGGTISSLQGRPATYLDGHVVASNGRIHDALVAAVG